MKYLSLDHTIKSGFYAININIEIYLIFMIDGNIDF